MDVAGPVGTEQTAAPVRWGELLADGRGPRLALILLGVWLNAADALVTATIMPSVGRDLGSYAWFSWAVAAFLLGAILAGASAGRTAERLGMVRATVAAGVTFAAGCALSACAPSMPLFLLGRWVQGAGSGWVSGFAMVAVVRLFPQRLLSRVFACVTAVWGVATVLGPLFGGLLVEGGGWRWVFWSFALQAAVFTAAAPVLLRGAGGREERAPGVPWTQLGVLALAAAALAAADVSRSPGRALAALAAAVVLLWALLQLDARASVRLLPKAAGDLSTVAGAGYAALFALLASEVGFSIYAPALLQRLRGTSPLQAGYVVGAVAVGWTACGIVVQAAQGVWATRAIRAGGLCVLAGVGALALVIGRAQPLELAAGALLVGAGFGLCGNLLNARVIASLPEEERAVGGSGLVAVQQTGGAAGAAAAGVAANLAGFGPNVSEAAARASGHAVLGVAVPLAAAGAWALWRMTAAQARAHPG